MKTRIENIVLTAAVVGCAKAVNSAGMAPASTSVGTEIDDSVVTSSVKAALLGDAKVKSFDIAVVTRKDEVLLTGFVDNREQMDRAIEIARSIEGVHSVSNEMSIKK